MTGDTMRDELARCIADPGRYVGRGRTGNVVAESVARWGARAILASGVLDRIKADAWREGFDAAVTMYRYRELAPPTNPFERQETGA